VHVEKMRMSSQTTCREELCENDIKMNLEEIGYEGVNWFLLA